MRVIAHEKPNNAVALEVVDLQLLSSFRVMEVGRSFEVAALNFSQQTVVVPSVFPEQQANPAQDIAEVGIVEAEANEQERFRDKIALQRHRKQMPRC